MQSDVSTPKRALRTVEFISLLGGRNGMSLFLILPEVVRANLRDSPLSLSIFVGIL